MTPPLFPPRVVLGVALLLGAADAGAQSLWTSPGSTERSAISDPVARRVGDVVTILVVERLSVQDDGKLELSKESELDSAITTFDIAPDAFDPLPTLGYRSERTLDGESKFSQQGRVEMTISATIVDVKQNGVLLIEGQRSLWIDGDEKRMVVRGLVRPLDITGSNTVNSDRIADAEVRFENLGPRSHATRKNWFERLLDFLWPF